MLYLKTKNFFETIYNFIYVIGFMVIYAICLPFFKIGLFHWMVWKEWKKGKVASALLLYFFSCLPIHIGIIFIIYFIFQGRISIF